MRPEDLVALEEQERRKRLQWSVVIRYLVIFIVVLLSWVGSQFGAAFFLPGILFSVAMALGFNLAFSYLYSRETVNPMWPYIGIFIDMAVVTTIVHFTGGITSVFLPLYLLQIVGTNVQFSRLAGPVNFIVGTALFALLFMLEKYGIFIHYTPFDVAPDLHENFAFIAATGVTLVVLMAVSTYRSGYVVRSLQNVESELAKFNEALARTNQTFQTANQRLKDLDQMKTEFISVASHQLRTPLSGIKWSLKMLIDHDLGPLTIEQEDMLLKGYQSNERMIALINDLLSVSRIEEGRMTYAFHDENLDPVIREIVEDAQHLASEKHIALTYVPEVQPLPVVHIDKQKFQLALQNLIDNALKYTSIGGIIGIQARVQQDELVLSVQDTGVGIPVNQHTRVFSKFFRGDNVMRMQTEGTGLGLFITHDVVVQHHGRIWFESHEGRGSTFYVALPLVGTKPLAPKPQEHFDQVMAKF
ncbi:MAG: HAMP domain-containing sensor histidine kinase [Patescibacteria group bacterium]